MTEQKYPKGWDEQRVKRLIAQCDSMSDDELVAEDEAAAINHDGQSVVTVPDELLPAIRKLLATAKSA